MKQQRDEFNSKYLEYMKGFDFFLDFDCPKIGNALADMKKAKEIMDEYRVNYWILFSGKKGFHIRVDYNDFPEHLKKMDFIELTGLLSKFTHNFKTINGLEYLDPFVIDLRRICKTPYSI